MTNRISFAQYVGLLPQEIVINTLAGDKPEVKRNVISSSLINKTISQRTDAQHVCETFKNLPESLQVHIARTYLMGDRGYICDDATAGTECVQSFLVYQAGSSSSRRLYGFPELSAALEPLCAALFATQTVTGPQEGLFSIRQSLCDSIVPLIVLAGVRRTTSTAQTIKRMGKRLLHKLIYNPAQPVERESIEAWGECVESFCRDEQLIVHGFDTSYDRITDYCNQSETTHYAALKKNAHIFAGSWDLGLLRACTADMQTTWLPVSAFSAKRAQVWDDCIVLAASGCISIAFFDEQWHIRWRTQRQSLPESSGGSTEAPRLLSNFSVVVSPGVTPATLWQFSCIGHIQSFDKVYKGAVDRVAVCDARAAGVEASTIESLLSRWEAPANVARTVSEWIREFDRLSMITGTVVLSTSAEVSQLLSVAPQLRDMLTPLPAESVFLVAPHAQKEVSEILEKLGFDIRMASTAVMPDYTTDEQFEDGFVAEEPVIEFVPTVIFPINGTSPVVKSTAVHRQGKYSAELKVLDTNEIVHLVEYAQLMGYRIKFEYSGSPGIRKGNYSISGVSLIRGKEMGVEGKSGPGTIAKKFLFDKIITVGVEE